jgi:hypothetical protein
VRAADSGVRVTADQQVDRRAARGPESGTLCERTLTRRTVGRKEQAFLTRVTLNSVTSDQVVDIVRSSRRCVHDAVSHRLAEVRKKVALRMLAVGDDLPEGAAGPTGADVACFQHDAGDASLGEMQCRGKTRVARADDCDVGGNLPFQGRARERRRCRRLVRS